MKKYSLILIALILLCACQSESEITPLPTTPSPSAQDPTLTPTNTPIPPTEALPEATLTPTTLPENSPTPSITMTATSESTATPIGESSVEGVRVTFIHNAGFLVTVGEKRIMIDVIYRGYPDGVLKPILESRPPFDGVDLILATHDHQDHFAPDLVLKYLWDNPQTEFVSNPAAVNDILALDRNVSGRLTAVDLAVGETEQLSIGEIELEVLYLSHGVPGLINLGFIITVDGVRILHTGDISPEDLSVSELIDYGLPEKGIEIAFVPDFLLTVEQYYPYITEGIQARYLIPMHFPPMTPPQVDQAIFPDVILLMEPYQSWYLPDGG